MILVLTVLTDSLQGGSRGVDFALDLAGMRVVAGEQTILLTRKGFALLGLLTLARLLELKGERNGWVTYQEIGTLQEWTSERSISSLQAQIRREIRRLEGLGLDAIDARGGAKVRGPFRLRSFPTVNRDDVERLAARFAPDRRLSSSQTAAELFQWLEAAEPVWRTAHYFDKQDEVLTDSLDLPAPDIEQSPILAAINFINRARRHRELGDYDHAKQSIANALVATRKIASTSYVRVHLEASCHLQQGWLDYRWNRIPDAERCASAALAMLGGEAHLRVRGQILSLRSILRRIRRRYDDALQDLRLASECWLVEGDLHNLFSVFHNLSTLVAEQASHETDLDRQRELLKQAVAFCKKSDDYCRRYNVGQNSIISIIQAVSLYTQLGDFSNAKFHADRGFTEALEKDNLADAAKAHGHRVRLLLWKRDFAEAETIQSEFLARLGDHALRTLVDERYLEMVRQARMTPGCLPTTGGLDGSVAWVAGEHSQA